jgi:uncharacterized protein
MLCDSNVWLALALFDHAHHDAARAWLETVTDAAFKQFGELDLLLIASS